MSIVIIIVIVGLVVGGLVFALISTNKIKKNGIETEGEISRIDIETTDKYNNETNLYETETTKHYFVTYTNQNGETIESSLINPKMGLKEGDKIKIKYLPEKPKNVLRVK